MDGKCSLCGEIRPLCNSHIIPEFVYKPAYDVQHKLHVLNLSSKIKKYRIQKGIKQKMLCSECESFLNKTYEKPFYDYWFTNRVLPDPFPPGIYWLKGIDYAAFKLFHLSVLYRAHFATQEMFEDIALAESHVARLRELLLNQNPGDPHEFSIMGTVAIDDDRIPRYDLIMKAENLRQDTHKFCCFVFGACSWMYKISQHQDPIGIKYCLRPSGCMPTIGMHLKESHGFKEFYLAYLKKL